MNGRRTRACRLKREWSLSLFHFSFLRSAFCLLIPFTVVLSGSHPEQRSDKSPGINQHRKCYRQCPRPRGWAVEAPRSKAGASRKGNVFVKVPFLPTGRGTSRPPGAVQRRILFLLNDCLRCLTLKVTCRRHHDDPASHLEYNRRAETRGRNRPPSGPLLHGHDFL